MISTLICGAVCAQTIKLPTLDIVTKKHKNKEVKAPNISVAFSGKNISQSGASSVTGFLQEQSIVQIKNHSNNQNQAMISIHGFGNNASDNTLLQVDGVPMTTFTEGGPNLNSILVQNIQKMIIVPGSYGSLYGNQAVGGVVNVQTHVPGKPEAIIGAGIGNQGQNQVNAFVSKRFASHIGISLGGNFSHTDNYQPHNKQDNANFNGKIDYVGNDDLVSLNVMSYRNYFELPGYKVWGSPASTTSDDNSSVDVGKFIYLTNRYFVTPTFRIDTDLVSFHNTNWATFFNAKQTQQSVLWQNKIHFDSWLKSGFSLEQDSFTNDNTHLNSKAKAKTAAAFTQFTIPIVTNVHLILGTRFAKQWFNTETKTSPSMDTNDHVFVNEEGLSWQPKPNLSFYVRRDTNYRLINGKEKIWTDDSITTLKTQTGVSLETGLNWHNDLNQFKLGLYELDLDNEIAYNPNVGAFGSISNLPPTRRIGLDLYELHQVNRHLTLGFQSNLVKPTFRSGAFKGKQIPSVSEINSGVAATVKIPQNWVGTIVENFHSKSYASNDLENAGPQMPSYFMTNFNVQKRWNRLTANLSVDNVFNKKFPRYAEYYPPNQFNPSAETRYYPSNGITFLFTLEYRLVG